MSFLLLVGEPSDDLSFSPDGAAPPSTLPDLLRPGLDIVFVGINPSIYSAQRGRYFARPSNRFWPCLSRSTLSLPARAGLGVAVLGPQHDTALPAYGIGFTDVVKRPTARAADVGTAELRAGVAQLRAKLEGFGPRIACFHGITGYRHVHDLFGSAKDRVELGPQALRMGATHVFLVPNPSGANAHVSRAEQTRWYDRLADYLRALPTGRPSER